MLKKKIAFIALSVLTGFSLVGTALGTMSWFVTTVETPKYNIDGKSAGAYFAYGDGSAEKPFGISIPRHLYNLSWLQYMGQFDDKQYYFELSKSIDDETGLNMNNFILPPIGTEDNPFVGNFNGNGKIITNLTVTNDEDAIFGSNKHPDQTQVTYEAPEIVGLFGVVGNLDGKYTGTYDSNVNAIYDLGITGFTIETSTAKALVGIAAGYVDAVVSNVVVNDSSINVKNSGTLAVDGEHLTSNLSDYGVVGYATDDYKKTIRRSSQNLYDIFIDNPAKPYEFNASDDGDSQGWGGSINMKTIYNRICSISSLKKNIAADVASGNSYGNGTLNYRIDQTYFDDELDSTTNYSNVSTTNSRVDGYSRYNAFSKGSHQYIGSYNVYARQPYYTQGYGGSDYATYGDQAYLYMCGGHYENRTYYSYYEHVGQYITDGSGNYLSYNFSTSTFYNTTDSSNATLWTFEQYSGQSYYVTTTYNGTKYYIYYNSGSLGLSTSTGATRRWTLFLDNPTTGKMRITYDTSKIYFYNSEWTLIPTSNQEVVDYYVIKSGSNYISNSIVTGSNNVGSTTNANNAAQFHIEDDTNYVYVLNGNTKYYLTWYRQSSWGSTTNYLNYNTNPNASNYYPMVYNGTNLRAARSSWGNTTYMYIRYNSGWVLNSSNYSIVPTAGHTSTISYSTMNLDNTFDDDPVTGNPGPDYHQTSADTTKSSTNSHMYYTATDTSYFPLNVENDLKNYISNEATMNTEINSGNLDPKDSNTGYIIAGSSIASNANPVNAQISNIRISRYTIDNVDASYNKTSGSTTTIADLADSSVYTYKINSDTDPSGGITHGNMSGYSATTYPRYADSKTSFFQNSLAASSDEGITYKTNAYVYGLHFMSSSISKNSIVNASKVSVLGNKCDNYQFPVNCIDFNLKQKGVVNFFAGTYYDDNNSFFSIHQIFRNNDATGYDSENKTYTSFNTINDIKQIVEVWSTDVGEKTSKYANIYKYSDGSYSTPYRIDGNQNKYVMNPTSAADSSTAYTYSTMNSTVFNQYVSTYGYKLKFLSSQIGKQNSAYTTNRIYYFEFPMNDGEYCLGSVDGGTGAYLLYLDIGANAAKTQRTIAYEHFAFVEDLFNYPNGIAVNAVAIVSTNKASGTSLDETDTSNFFIAANTSGIVSVSREANDVELSRSGGLLTSAKPTLVGDNMWDSEYQVYNIHNPGGDNLSSEITSEKTVADYTRLVYYDYNVNLDELMITVITDVTTDGGDTYTRTFYQKYQNGTSTTDVDEMRIYNTANGNKYSSEDLIDPDESIVKTYRVVDDEPVISDALILRVEYVEENGVNAEMNWLLELDVNTAITSGRYYKFKDYIFEVTIESGELEINVISKDASRTIYINDVPITSTGVYTIAPPDTVTRP